MRREDAAGRLQPMVDDELRGRCRGRQEIREGIKEYGNWPTIPQLYINKQLVGGSDIMMEMYQTGELQTLLK